MAGTRAQHHQEHQSEPGRQREEEEEEEEYISIPPPLLTPNSNQPLAHQRRIFFRHPAYPTSAPPLLVLPAVDGGRLGVGIHYRTAIVACGVIAGNRFRDAWFGQRRTCSTRDDDHDDASPFQRCDEPLDGILRDDEYYFFVDNDNKQNHEYKYPVVPSFDHWRFPHDNIPEPWSRLTSTLLPLDNAAAGRVNPFQQWNDIVMTRDRSCRVTGYQEGCEVAHLVPREKGTWFVNNNMTLYSSAVTSPVGAVDDALNALLLRSDLHRFFDRRRFTFVPKGSKSRLVVHQMLPSPSREMHHLYHNRATQPETCGIAPQFLLARFAWTVLCDENYAFLKGPQRYAVTLWNPDKGEVSVKTMGWKDITAASQIFSSPAKTRSVSPRKWKQEDPREGEWGDDGHSDDGYGYVEVDSISNGESRGRSRTRRAWYPGVDLDASYSQEEEGAHLNDSLSTISTVAGDVPGTPTAYRESHTSNKNMAAMDLPARKLKRVTGGRGGVH